MSKHIKFIENVIRNLKPTNKREIYWFNGHPGFGLRITPKGTKTFVYKYTTNNKSRWITIGKYPKKSSSDARSDYGKLYKKVAEYGEDPVQDKKDENSKFSGTVADFVPIYLDICKLKNKKTTFEEERYFNRDIIPIIGDKEFNDVTIDDIEKIQFEIIKRSIKKKNATRDGKVAAKHAIACTRRLFNLAKRKGLTSHNPVYDIEPLGVTGRRDRVLSFVEIWRFWNRVETIGISPVTAKALKFALTTMQRSIEVRKIRYQSFKVEENIWQMEMSETKSKTMHRVPLNKQALQLIDEAKPFTDASPYIFGATRAHKPPTNKNKHLIPLTKTAFPQAIRKNRDKLGIDNFCPHDLRRTGATWITAVGLPKLYARLMLNHSDGDRDVTGEVYVQYSYDFEKRRAANVWAFILDQIVTCKSEDDIPTLDELRDRVINSGLM